MDKTTEGGQEKTADALVREKNRLRDRFRTARSALSDEAYHRSSAAVCARLLSHSEIKRAITGRDWIHVYWPLVARRELDTRPFIDAVMEHGGRIALPRVVPEGAARRLTHHPFTTAGALVMGRWGLREPAADAPTVSPNDLAVVVVPGLAFDRRGHRLGYGAGFYDRFLDQTGAFRLGVTLESYLTKRLPAAPHDRRVHAVVTEMQCFQSSHATPSSEAP